MENKESLLCKKCFHCQVWCNGPTCMMQNWDHNDDYYDCTYCDDYVEVE